MITPRPLKRSRTNGIAGQLIDTSFARITAYGITPLIQLAGETSSPQIHIFIKRHLAIRQKRQTRNTYSELNNHGSNLFNWAAISAITRPVTSDSQAPQHFTITVLQIVIYDFFLLSKTD